MPRTSLPPTTDIAAVLPSDWTTATDADKTRVKDGLREILLGRGCECNGHRRARNSVETTIQERIRAMAMSRRVQSGVRELASSRGVDVDTASAAEISASASAEEIASLFAMEQLISAETISAVVTNGEMAQIETEELAKTTGIRDPGWNHDLSEFVSRSVVHQIYGQADSGLLVAKTVAVKLETLVAEVDDNGEICCWMYEEPEVDS